MDWIFQTEGEINHYNPLIHQGTQPVRVIHHMIVHMFRNSNPEFFNDLLLQIREGKLNRELGLQYGEVPIVMEDSGILRTPRINGQTRAIEIHETFLSYLWCCTYSVFTLYSQIVDFPKVNRERGEIVHPINPELIRKARELFTYAKYIIKDFRIWDKRDLPNPEIYDASERNFVELTTAIYTEAAKFILCHEFTHLKYHIDAIDSSTPDSHFLDYEFEADNNAINILTRGILSSAHKLAVENGIVMGILSMFFFRATTTGVRHPNAEDRLTNALEALHLDDNPFAWGIACVGLQLWDEQFGLNLTWSDSIVNYKQEYYRIIEQIKSRT